MTQSQKQDKIMLTETQWKNQTSVNKLHFQGKSAKEMEIWTVPDVSCGVLIKEKQKGRGT